MCILTVPQCSSTGSVRLVGGASSNEGRMEVCVNGMWGTVTYYQWDSREVTVVCKQLGYQNPGEWNAWVNNTLHHHYMVGCITNARPSLQPILKNQYICHTHSTTQKCSQGMRPLWCDNLCSLRGIIIRPIKLHALTPQSWWVFFCMFVCFFRA